MCCLPQWQYVGPLFFPPWIYSWVDLRNPISMPAGQRSYPSHRPLTVTMNTLPLPPTSLDRWASRPQSSGTFTRACRKEIIITLNSPSYLFHPVPIHLVHWAKLNFQKCILEYVAMDPVCPQDKASLPEEAASARPHVCTSYHPSSAPLHSDFLCCSVWGTLSGAGGRPTVPESEAPGATPNSKGWECGTNTPISQLSFTA